MNYHRVEFHVCKCMDCLSSPRMARHSILTHNTHKIVTPWRPIRTLSAPYLINISTSTAPTQPKLGHMQPLVLFTIRPNYYALSTLFLALRILFWHAYRPIPISHPKNIVIEATIWIFIGYSTDSNIKLDWKPQVSQAS